MAKHESRQHSVTAPGCAGDVVDVIIQNNMANAFNGDYR